jgi:HlyD family secretion protein
VSGTISFLGADFNSIVHRGQVLARLDPALFDAQVESARSQLAKATADTEAADVAVGDAQTKLAQARALHDKQLIADADFDAAEVALKEAVAQREENRSQQVAARASLDQATVNRAYTVITSPIDGIVVARNVDIGQTVAAAYQAPTLFVIANDLARMQLNAGIDESDVGTVRVGEPVTFTVDAYPQEEFRGVVKQVRLQPNIVQNVVTYSTVIAVDNSDLRLKPGMTATLNVEVARSRNVLRVPAPALRYVPRPQVFAALGERVPPELAQETAHRQTGASGSRGFVWVDDGKELRTVPVTVGLSDGALAEVQAPALGDGTAVVTAEFVASPGRMVATPLSPMRPMPMGR